MVKNLLWAWWLCLGLLLVACQNKNEVPVRLPTPAQAEAVKTAIIQTQNAPPAGFESAAFNPIDYNRDLLPTVYFEVIATVTAKYTADGTDANGTVTMKVWENNLLRTRRVILTFEGEVMSGGVQRVEAVRFENDFYLLDSNNICTKNTAVAQDIATLTAGRLVGGFTLALPIGNKTTLNGYEAFQYGFAEEDLVLNIFRETPSLVDIVGGEAWVLPELQVIGRFGVSINVHNAKILFGEQPVTGSLKYEYNLLEVGQEMNIALPNGC